MFSVFSPFPSVISGGVWDIDNPTHVELPKLIPENPLPVRDIQLIRKKLWVTTGSFLTLLDPDMLTSQVSRQLELFLPPKTLIACLYNRALSFLMRINHTQTGYSCWMRLSWPPQLKGQIYSSWIRKGPRLLKGLIFLLRV